MRHCSSVGQYIECTGKITIRKTDDKLYHMQYGFVALYLSFVCIEAGFIFPTSKELPVVYTTEFSVMTWFHQPMSHTQIIISCPQLNYQSGVESSEIDPSPEAQIVHNRGHG